MKTENVDGIRVYRLRECFLFSPLEGHVERDSRKWLIKCCRKRQFTMYCDVNFSNF